MVADECKTEPIERIEGLNDKEKTESEILKEVDPNVGEGNKQSLNEVKRIEGLNDKEKTESEILKEVDPHVGEGNKQSLNEVNREKKIHFNPNLAVRISGFKRLPSMREELKQYYTFFTEEMDISPPFVEIPAPDDESVLFQPKSENDKGRLFVKMKKKVYIWKTYKLEINGFSHLLNGKELERLKLESALKLLYPYRDLTYGKQLKEKNEISKAVIDLILPQDNLRKLNIREDVYQIKPILPMPSVEGYDHHVSFTIEEDSETNDIITGIRVIDEEKKKTAVVPIDLCLNVPHQMTIVVKDFVNTLPDFGWHPYNQKTKEGNLLGITLQMTYTGHYIMTVIIPDSETSCLKQLTPDGIDGEEISIQETYSCKNNKNRESAVERIEKYFIQRGKDFGIESVYLTMINARLSILTCGDDATPDASHILGELCVSDNHNGLPIQITWSKDLVVDNSLKYILNIIYEMGNINNSSTIYLIFPSRIAALYLAKKYALVKMFCDSNEDDLKSLNSWSKTAGINNIEFIDTNNNYWHSSLSLDNAVALVWKTKRSFLVNQLLERGITNIIFVSDWMRDPSLDYINITRTQLKIALEKLKLRHIYPIDVAPYTKRHGLVVFFHGRRSSFTNKRRYNYRTDGQLLTDLHSGYQSKRSRQSSITRRNRRESLSYN